MSETFNFESGHNEMIHDAQLDYYGKTLATCSSDKLIKLFHVNGNNITILLIYLVMMVQYGLYNGVILNIIKKC